METVKIVDSKGKRGWRIINKCDMKESDKLYSESEQKKPAARKKQVKKDG